MIDPIHYEDLCEEILLDIEEILRDPQLETNELVAAVRGHVFRVAVKVATDVKQSPEAHR